MTYATRLGAERHSLRYQVAREVTSGWWRATCCAVEEVLCRKFFGSQMKRDCWILFRHGALLFLKRTHSSFATGMQDSPDPHSKRLRQVNGALIIWHSRLMMANVILGPSSGIANLFSTSPFKTRVMPFLWADLWTDCTSLVLQ